jgi:hypothetical protein
MIADILPQRPLDIKNNDFTWYVKEWTKCVKEEGEGWCMMATESFLVVNKYYLLRWMGDRRGNMSALLFFLSAEQLLKSFLFLAILMRSQ